MSATGIKDTQGATFCGEALGEAGAAEAANGNEPNDAVTAARRRCGDRQPPGKAPDSPSQKGSMSLCFELNGDLARVEELAAFREFPGDRRALKLR